MVGWLGEVVRDGRPMGGHVEVAWTGHLQQEVDDEVTEHIDPRSDGKLWVLNSGRGELCRVDEETGAREVVTFLPGFARGLAFHGPYAFVGLSLPRDGSFSGLELDGELAKRDAEPWCGVQIVDTRNGNIVEWIRLKGEVRELFDVFVLPGVSCPKATGLLDGSIRTDISIENWSPDDRRDAPSGEKKEAVA